MHAANENDEIIAKIQAQGNALGKFKKSKFSPERTL